MPRALRVTLSLVAFALVLGLTAGLALDAAAAGSTSNAGTMTLDELEAALFIPEGREMSGDEAACSPGFFEVDCVIDPDPCGRHFTAWGCCPNGTTATCEPIEIEGSLCYRGVEIVCS